MLCIACHVGPRVESLGVLLCCYPLLSTFSCSPSIFLSLSLLLTQAYMRYFLYIASIHNTFLLCSCCRFPCSSRSLYTVHTGLEHNLLPKHFAHDNAQNLSFLHLLQVSLLTLILARSCSQEAQGKHRRLNCHHQLNTQVSLKQPPLLQAAGARCSNSGLPG